MSPARWDILDFHIFDVSKKRGVVLW